MMPIIKTVFSEMLFHVDSIVSNKCFLFLELEPQIQEEDIANGKRIRVNKDDLIGL